MDPVVVERRIAAGTDDVEEAANGSMYFDSSDLELTDDPEFNGTNQTIGLRFAGLGIPQGAVITSAYLQFQVDEADSGAVSLEIRGQDADNAGAFTSGSGDVSARPTTSSVIGWSPPAWTTAGASGPDQRTPDLAELVQQIVDRPGWAPDNALAFIVSGSGERTAISYDADPGAAPLLHVEYVLADPGNQAPAANDDTALTQSDQAVVINVLANDGDPNGDPLTVSAVGAAANGQAGVNPDGTITYAPNAGFSGTDSFSYTVSDPEGLSDTATVNLTVTSSTPDPVIVERRIASGSDDVEQAASGTMYFDSSDLELVDDPEFNGNGQTIGLRFAGLGIPQGAVITAAYLQFQVDEADTGTVSLQIRGQDADNAAAFSSASGDLTSRATTASVIGWSPAAWTGVGASGLEQRTPDLSDVVQQIVNRPGWAPDNALAFLVSGSGERTAESFDGDPGAAPLLHVEYVAADPGNQAPAANDDAASTQSGQAVAINVLANDGDPDGDPLTVSAVGAAANGQASLNPDGTITYAPNAGFSGTDSFTYTVSDPEGQSDTATVNLTVTPSSPVPVTVEQRIALGTDDVEQAASGTMYFDSSDLELVDDPDFNGNGQTIGLRFAGLGIPQGAVITAAYLQFQVDEADSGAVSLQIRGQDVDDAAVFSSASGDLTARATTSSLVNWSPGAWTSVGASGLEQRTPDLSGVVQQIVNRPDWAPDNALAFLVSGNGTRTAESFDGDPGAAPLLHVEYLVSDPGNQAPAASDDGAATQAGQTVVIDVLSNDGDPDGDPLTISAVGAAANGQAGVNPDGTIAYTPNAGFSGTDSFTYTVTDPGGLSDTATVSVTVTPSTPGPVTVERRIAASTDDAEEAASGTMYFDSSDLELVDDPDFNGVGQTVGLRFSDMGIPQGAVITAAYLQFQVDELDGETAALQIRAQAADTAGAFSAASGDLSARATTGSVVDWSPEAWTTVGAAGPAQRTPDLSGLVQQIVDRPGWVADNALAFLISGTGERSAESFDGDASAAPLLHVEYVVPDPNNQAPTDIEFGNIQIITENQAGALAATLNVVDPDSGDSHTFTLSDDRFEVVSSQLKLKDDERLDFERSAQVSLDVTAIDSGGWRITETLEISVADVSETRFAAVGDYAYGQDTQDVADLIDSLNVDFIVTTGDNAYDDVPIDENVGIFYADYIGNYQGSYGPGSPVNLFFPALGNHEYTDNSAGLNGGIDIYLDYFTLPGNERYYDVEMGPIHFFVVNSNSSEPDGIDASSVQAAWLQAGLAASTSAHKIVVFHHPSYSSGSHGDHPVMQWPFEDWGATAVLNGHDHTYERVLRDDNSDGTILPYLVTGLGGRSINPFSGTTTEGSAAQYNANFGAILAQATDTGITFEFVSIEGGGTVVDSYTLDLNGAAAPQAASAPANSKQKGMENGLVQTSADTFVFSETVAAPQVAALEPAAELAPRKNKMADLTLAPAAIEDAAELVQTATINDFDVL